METFTCFLCLFLLHFLLNHCINPLLSWTCSHTWRSAAEPMGGWKFRLESYENLHFALIALQESPNMLGQTPVTKSRFLIAQELLCYKNAIVAECRAQTFARACMPTYHRAFKIMLMVIITLHLHSQEPKLAWILCIVLIQQPGAGSCFSQKMALLLLRDLDLVWQQRGTGPAGLFGSSAEWLIPPISPVNALSPLPR